MSALVLERQPQQDEPPVFVDDEVAGTMAVVITPPISEDYWLFRVRLSERQAIVGFPKFFTIGIGFAVEDADWNTNFPYTSPADEIYEHIAVNQGDAAITREQCLEAIQMIQAAAAEYMEAKA